MKHNDHAGFAGRRRESGGNEGIVGTAQFMGGDSQAIARCRSSAWVNAPVLRAVELKDSCRFPPGLVVLKLGVQLPDESGAHRRRSTVRGRCARGPHVRPHEPCVHRVAQGASQQVGCEGLGVRLSVSSGIAHRRLSNVTHLSGESRSPRVRSLMIIISQLHQVSGGPLTGAAGERLGRQRRSA